MELERDRKREISVPTFAEIRVRFVFAFFVRPFISTVVNGVVTFESPTHTTIGIPVIPRGCLKIGTVRQGSGSVFMIVGIS